MKDYLVKFVEWAKLKIKIHISEKKVVYFKEKEIWWASLGMNIGHEQDGKNETFERPVLIFKKFNKELLWILPLTSQSKLGKYYYQFEHDTKQYSVILSQIRTISSKRLLRKIRKINSDDFIRIKKRVKNLF